MPLLLILYVVLLWLEPVFHVKAPVTLPGDFELSYNLMVLLLLNAVFYFRYFTAPRPSVSIDYLTFIVVVLFSSVSTFFTNVSSFLSAASLLVQFLLQSTLIVYIGSIGRRRALRYLLYFFWAFAYFNCAIVYLSFFFPDAFEGIAEIHGYFGYNPNERPDFIRAFGILGDAAPWLLSFFCIACLQTKRYAPALFFAGTTLLGGSIGASIVMGIAVFVTLTINQRNSQLAYLKVIGAGIALFFAILWVKPSWVLNNPIASRLLEPQLFKHTSGAQRLFTYGLALNYIAQNPITGYGYGTFLYNLKNTLDYRVSFFKFKDGALSNANNQILQTWFETGLAGLAVLIWVVLRVLKKIKRGLVFGARQPDLEEFKKAVLVWLSCFLLFNQTAVYLIPSLFWVFICCLIGMCFSINKILQLETAARTESARHGGR